MFTRLSKHAVLSVQDWICPHTLSHAYCLSTKSQRSRHLTAVKCMMIIDSLSGERLCWFEQGDGEPEGAALPHFGHGPQQAPQHRHLLGADAKAKPCSPPSSGALHVILCPLCRPATFKHNILQSLMPQDSELRTLRHLWQHRMAHRC